MAIHSVGLDIMGPFPKAVGNKRYLLVGIDYFTKWVETKPLANIRDVDAKRFVWKNIVTQFGVLHALILDNDLQFDSKAFRSIAVNWGSRIGILPLLTSKGTDKQRPLIRS